MKKNLFILSIVSCTFLTTGAGYVGTLPNVEAEFSYMKKEKSQKPVAPYSVQELDKKNEKKLKPIPRKDDNYVDIIIKKEKTTSYVNDMNSIIIILEKLRVCINTDRDIQKFNAIVSNLIDNIQYVVEEYKGKPESNYLSYNRLIVLSNEARSVANYRMQGRTALKYTPYTSSQNIYTKENLDAKLEKLLLNVNETLFVLKNLE